MSSQEAHSCNFHDCVAAVQVMGVSLSLITLWFFKPLKMIPANLQQNMLHHGISFSKTWYLNAFQFKVPQIPNEPKFKTKLWSTDRWAHWSSYLQEAWIKNMFNFDHLPTFRCSFFSLINSHSVSALLLITVTTNNVVIRTGQRKACQSFKWLAKDMCGNMLLQVDVCMCVYVW